LLCCDVPHVPPHEKDTDMRSRQQPATEAALLDLYWNAADDGLLKLYVAAEERYGSSVAVDCDALAEAMLNHRDFATVHAITGRMPDHGRRTISEPICYAVAFALPILIAGVIRWIR
jgi:hypothetical protein